MRKLLCRWSFILDKRAARDAQDFRASIDVQAFQAYLDTRSAKSSRDSSLTAPKRATPADQVH
eukprot:4521328-Prorocentrum_lima.AAC.1